MSVAGSPPDLAASPAAECGAVPPRETRTPRAELAVLAAIVLIGWLLRIYCADTASYWFDESSSWKTIQSGWTEIWTPISRNVHPPFYYLVLKSWAALFGDGPMSLRMCSATLGAVASALAYLFIRDALRPCNEPATAHLPSADDSPPPAGAAALTGAALLAVNGMQVSAGVQARMYPLGICLALLCAWSTLRVLRNGGHVWEWLVLAFSGIALTLTHYYGLFTAAAIGAMLLGGSLNAVLRHGWNSRSRRLLTGLALSAWAAANVWGLWLPQFQAQRQQVTADYFIRPFEWPQLARMTRAMVTGPEQDAHASEWAWGVLEWWGGVCLLAFVWGGRGGRLAAVAATAPLAGSVAYCLAVRSIFAVRYFLFAQTFLLIAWTIVIYRLPWRPLQVALTALSLIWSSYWTAQHLAERERRSAEHGLRDAAVTVDEWRSPEDVVLVGQGVIHPTIQQYARSRRDRIFVLDRGRPYPHYQGGPLLREDEYVSPAALRAMPVERVFTVDIYNLWGRGSRYDVSLDPDVWELVRERWFHEEYGQPCRIFVREYRRRESRPPLPQVYVAHTARSRR